ncbi:MAG: hypothetical protein QW279_16140 [Candidatus Jordarchaeaceae archaeon]
MVKSNSKIVEKEKKVLFRNLVNMPSTTNATFALYRYPAKFIPHVIAYVLEKYAHPNMKVFDPFAGYGTVGVVSRIYGCDYELWDLNPLLKFFHAIATQKLRDVRIKEIIPEMAGSSEEFIPKWSNLHYWFAEDFLDFLFRIWGFYHSLEDDNLKLVLTLPLLKTTRYFSYDDMQRQKLSMSPKSKERVKMLLMRDWKREFFMMLEKETIKVLNGSRQYEKMMPKQTNAIVKSGVDSLSMDLEEESDILITSPPYLQSQEYIRQAKMDLFWMGYSEDFIQKLSKLEIPYREVPPYPVYSELYSSLRKQIVEPHIRRVFDRYFWGVLGALTRLQNRIKSYLFLFVGQSSMRGQPVPIDHIFIEHFSSLGWVHEATLIDTIVARRMFSYGANPATGLKDKRTKTEHLVILHRKC